ncbi:MAG: hypothetical protein EPN41_15195 [Candidimonas sp.]|nr:MAG: hypothetical protein EPN41_15195 [Candidimonas sp.]
MTRHAILRYARRFLGPLFALAILAGFSGSAAAVPSCNVWSTNLSFGTINLLDTQETDAMATVTYGCSADPGQTILVCVNLAADPSTNKYSPRYLILNSGNSGARLAFDMYSDPAHTQVWGSGSAPGSHGAVPFVLSFGQGQYYQQKTATIYGQVRSDGQTSLPAGTYDTNVKGNWPISIDYIAYTGTAPSCSSSRMSTVNGTGFYISAVLQAECRINSSSEMNFGAVPSLDHNIDTSATISVTCNGSPYYVLLGDGQNAVSAGGQRRMKGPGGTYIDYELYKDSQRAQRWGNTDALGETNTGDGRAQSLTVYGRVPPQQTALRPGAYRDAVVITVDY